MRAIRFVLFLVGSLLAQPSETPGSAVGTSTSAPQLPLEAGGRNAVREMLANEKTLISIRREVRDLYPGLLGAEVLAFRKILYAEILYYLTAQRISNTLERERSTCRIILSPRPSPRPVHPELIVREMMYREREDPGLIAVAERSTDLVNGRDVKQPSDRVTVLGLTILMRRALVDHAEKIVKQTTPCHPVR